MTDQAPTATEYRGRVTMSADELFPVIAAAVATPNVAASIAVIVTARNN